VTVADMRRWVAPDVSVHPGSTAATLVPGDRFALDVFGGLRFDYLVEGATDREVVFTFSGPWHGRERWSFVPDGVETVVRRRYDADDLSVLGAIAGTTVGWALGSAHYRLELSRFRPLVEREAGPPAEIEAGDAAYIPPGVAADAGELPFPVDDG
jgi:hypothetical protein